MTESERFLTGLRSGLDKAALTPDQALDNLRKMWRSVPDPHTRAGLERLAAAINTIKAGGLA